MPQYYAKTVYLDATQGETTFSIDFEYQSQDDVVVTINGVETTDFTWSSPSTISLNTGTTSGDDVTIARRTNLATRSVDFQNAAELTEADLDASAEQVFNAVQEALDTVADSFTPRPDGSLSLDGRKLADVGAPEQDNDAVNKIYVDTKLVTNEALRDQTLTYRNDAAASAAAAAISEANAAASETSLDALSIQYTLDLTAAKDSHLLEMSGYRDDAAASALEAYNEFVKCETLVNNFDSQSLLPVLTGNDGKYLKVAAGGINTEWVDVDAVTFQGQPASYYVAASDLANTHYTASEVDTLVDAVDVKADSALSSASSNATAITSKADQSTVDSLTTTVNGKASQASLDSLTTTVNGKANTSGTYSGLRAQATTKADVGLGNVPNYTASSSATSSSTTTLATSAAVRTAYLKASSPLTKTTLWTGWTTGDISLSQPYTNFRFLVLVVGETDWGSSIVIETGCLSKAWERSGSKYTHAVGADGYIEILQSGSTTTYLNMGGSLRGWISAAYGVGVL